MSCIIYCRVSTERQEQEGVSLESQQQRCTSYAQARNLKVKAVYQDVKSGKKMASRPNFMAALNACKDGDVLLVAALTRLARNVRETLEIVEILKKKGAQLASVHESIDTSTAMGQLVFTIFAALSEMEAGVTSERVKHGLRHKKLRNEDLGAPPYGYKYVEKVLVENEDEQAVIKLMREWRDEDKSLREMVLLLNEAGHKPKRGGRWHQSTISRILQKDEPEEYPGQGELELE